jgi:alpha-galactosidase
LHGFPNGVGNWFCDPQKFPNGLKPVSDVCHRLGNKFILWFEPERVAKRSQIAKKHPEFVLGGKDDGLFNLGDPAARRWLTDLLSRRIDEYGVDVYRNDFNIDPLEFWRSNDAPDRQGMTEIRYVEGHYALWDELIARHPGLWIDNCASGGRRIDLETLMRSVPLWRSDTSCGPGHPDWNQTQTQGLSLYIPLFTACGWTPDAYDLRSSATGGAILQFDYMAEGFPFEKAKAAVDEAKENSKYWYGDFTSLTATTASGDQWAVYQFHRSDLNAGVVFVFRRAVSPYSAMSAELHTIDPAKDYAVEFIDDTRQKTEKTISGRELAAGLELRLPNKRSSLVVRYRALSQLGK